MFKDVQEISYLGTGGIRYAHLRPLPSRERTIQSSLGGCSGTALLLPYESPRGCAEELEGRDPSRPYPFAEGLVVDSPQDEGCTQF